MPIALLLTVALANPPVAGGGSTPPARVSALNSTAETLAGAASYTGTWESVVGYSAIAIRSVSAGAVDVYAQFSEDCSTLDASFTINDQAALSDFYTIVPTAECFRLKVTDVSGGSNAIRAEVIYHPQPLVAIHSTRMGSAVGQADPALPTRPISTFDYEASRGKFTGVSTVHKFGTNPSVSVTEQIVGSLGTAWAGQLATASTMRVKAGGNAADTAAGAGARTITIVGLNSAWDEASETITLAGANASANTSTSFIRLHRAYVETAGTYGGANTAAITVEVSAGGADIIQIPAGRGQSTSTFYTVPDGYTAYRRGNTVQVDGNKNANVYLYQLRNADDTSAPVASKRLITQIPGLSGNLNIEEQTWESYPARTDIWATAATLTSTAGVTVEYELILEATP